MNVFNFFQVAPGTFQSPSIAIGVFDGVHKGHQQLLSILKENARKDNGEAVVVTFSEHPRKILVGQGPISIVSFEARLELLKNYGVDACLVINFTPEVSQISPQAFVEEYLVRRLGIRNIVIGSNVRFGYQGKGDIALLRSLGEQYNYRVHVANLLQLGDGTIISSTNVRKVVSSGQMDIAQQMLGRPFVLSGKVIRGNKRGESLGFPTANLDLFHELIPCEGVYCGYSYVENHIYPALISIGTCPTFTDTGRLQVEVYLANFSGDLYDQTLHTYVCEKIRDQKKFPHREELCMQMQKDRDYLLQNWQHYTSEITPSTYVLH